jgi:hypothetical protein
MMRLYVQTVMRLFVLVQTVHDEAACTDSDQAVCTRTDSA